MQAALRLSSLITPGIGKGAIADDVVGDDQAASVFLLFRRGQPIQHPQSGLALSPCFSKEFFELRPGLGARLGKFPAQFPAHVFLGSLDGSHVRFSHLGKHSLDVVILELSLLVRRHQPSVELLPLLPTGIPALPQDALKLFDSRDEISASFFQPPLEVAPLSLHLHVENVPVHDAQNYTSDKMF